MSVSRASFLKMATPSGARRLSVIPRLLRCRFWKSKPWRLPPMPSPVRPPGISILIARAPQSTSWRTHVGPARARVRSSTEKRARGRAALLAMVAAHDSARLGAGQTADRRRRARKLGSFFHILWARHGRPHKDAAPQRVHHALQLLARRRRGDGSTHSLPRLVALTSRSDRHLAAEPAHESRHLYVLAFPDGDLVGPGDRAVLQRWLPALPRNEASALDGPARRRVLGRNLERL